MKKSFTYRLLMVIAITSILLTGCKKAVDFIVHHENTDLRMCNIQKLVLYDGKESTEAVFKYNECGDPLSITRPVIATGSPKYEFKYDRNHRLTDFIGSYSDNAGAEFWHKYVYDSHNHITLDSTFIFVSTYPIPWDYYFLYVHHLFYDNKDRIIKDSSVPIKDAADVGVTVDYYSYNASGNLTTAGHDNNINLHRTNKIWMFIDRDYSINNSFPNATFNSHQLPRIIQSNGSFLGLYFSTKMDVLYQCDEVAPK